MLLSRIFTLLLSALVVLAVVPVRAHHPGDRMIVDMQTAFGRKDGKKLAALLPLVRGHALEPWAAYWELRLRLASASTDEIEAFLQRWKGSYQEDRLRNDWLLLLGERSQWDVFAKVHPQFRMKDDRQVDCYALLAGHHKSSAFPKDVAAQVLRHWNATRAVEEGCTRAAAQLLAYGLILPLDVWRKARLAAEDNRPYAVERVVNIVAPHWLSALRGALKEPSQYLKVATPAKGKKNTASPQQGKQPPELVTLALVRLAMKDHTQAIRLLGVWEKTLDMEARNWLWGLIGRQAAIALSSDALGLFAKVERNADLSDSMREWKVRAALRAGQWRLVARTIDSMNASQRKDSTWVYWRARAMLAGHPSSKDVAQARALFVSIAGTQGFYEQLALEELGQRVTPASAPPPLTEAEKTAARTNRGLSRALYAIFLGLRSEGVREWNYTTSLHTPGGMGERELLAAADFACEKQVWDRCINTSERTKTVMDMAQRFPTPFRNAVLKRTQEIGLDPAYVYGLIRQESRFIMDARSGAGASGLMQVMPATARWTAQKIGLKDFKREHIYDRDTNLTIGTAYLKLALDSFDGSLPLAAAAYNAGPSRPRRWRNGPVLDAAIWAENVPFNETRDYVKKVLANTVNYAALLTGQPQSLKSRLGFIGPLPVGIQAAGLDLP